MQAFLADLPRQIRQIVQTELAQERDTRDACIEAFADGAFQMVTGIHEKLRQLVQEEREVQERRLQELQGSLEARLGELEGRHQVFAADCGKRIRWLSGSIALLVTRDQDRQGSVDPNPATSEKHEPALYKAPSVDLELGKEWAEKAFVPALQLPPQLQTPPPQQSDQPPTSMGPDALSEMHEQTPYKAPPPPPPPSYALPPAPPSSSPQLQGPPLPPRRLAAPLWPPAPPWSPGFKAPPAGFGPPLSTPAPDPLVANEPPSKAKAPPPNLNVCN